MNLAVIRHNVIMSAKRSVNSVLLNTMHVSRWLETPSCCS